MADYNPTNPAFDAVLNIETILKNMKPKKLESSSTKGIMSNRNETVEQSMSDGRQTIAKYVKILRDIREENKKDG